MNIILDFGSGNTCKNNKTYIKRMYDELNEVDSRKHKVIIKWQLFRRLGQNISLTENSFNFAYEYGTKLNYKVTSSVFSMESLEFLLGYDIPFIKLANKRETDFLINYIPERLPVYISKTHDLFLPKRDNVVEMWCISRYPAEISDYEKLDIKKGDAISDHTKDFTLFNKYKPKIVEWHYKLDFSSGLDAGSFAKTPGQLKEIL
jgi:sialic acid synthase SpsE